MSPARGYFLLLPVCAVIAWAPVLGAQELGEIRTLLLEDRLIEVETRLGRLLEDERRHDPLDSGSTARALDLLVECRIRAGRGGETQTLELARRAVAIRERDPAARTDLSTSLVNLARVRYARAHASAAHHHYTQLLAKREKTLGAESPDVSGTLTTLGRSKADLGDWEGALPVLERALALQSRNPAEDPVPKATTLANLARVHGYLRRPESRDYAQRCVLVLEALHSPDDPMRALALEDVARILQETGSIDDATDLVDQALGIWLKTQGPEHPFTGRAAIHAASLHRVQGDLQKARDLYDRYLPVLEGWPDAEAMELASALAGYSDVLEHLEDPQGAARLRSRAESISVTDPTFLSPDNIDVEVVRARELGRRGAAREALDVALKAEAVRRQALRLAGHTLPEHLALQMRETRASPLDVALSLCTGDLDADASRRVIDAIIRSRAVVLDEMAVRYRTLCELDRPEISNLFADFARATTQASRALVASPASFSTGSTDHRGLVKSREEAEAALAARSVVFRKELARSRAGLAEVVAALPPRSGLVGVVRYNEIQSPGRSETGIPSYIAFVLRPGSDLPLIQSLGPADPIDRVIEAWGQAMTLPIESNPKLSDARCREAGESLRRTIWDPILPLLGKVDRVFFVPDAALHQVSLATLPARDGQYLLETGPSFHYLSAERDLIPVDPPQESQGLLAVGGVDFDASLTARGGPASSPDDAPPGAAHYRGDHSRCRAFEAVRFEPLPGTQQEIEEIVALWSEGDPPGKTGESSKKVLQLLGAAAEEEAVKNHVAGRRVVHLATHGFFLAGDCPEPDPGRRGIGTLASEVSPDGDRSGALVLSGLALAGANRRDQATVGEEDGILTAEEIATLDLQGVEWAVLSGCDTGVGNFQAGEGVFGLRRAFSVAGARTLILSLWPIEDESARDWMRALYRARYRDHLDTPAAIRTASLRVLEERRSRKESTHPFYWGGFVAAGDWR